MDGFLCGDCHIEKTKEFVLKKQEEKKNFDDSHNICVFCNKDLILQTDKNKQNGNGTSTRKVCSVKIAMKKKKLSIVN